MFKEVRRKDRQLSEEETFKILAEGSFGVLGTVGEDGYPYTVPMNYVYTSGKIYFHCALEGHKLENIKYNDKVSFTVVTQSRVVEDKFTTKYASVVGFGKISKVDGVEKRSALVELIEKYTPNYLDKGMQYIDNAIDKTEVLKVDVERLTGKGNID